MTKRKMVATIQEKIRRLHEEKIVAEFTKGAVLYDVKMSSGIGHVPIPSLPITRQGFYACVTVVSLCVAQFPCLFPENGSRKRKRNSEFLLPDKRKKPVTVNDIQPVFIHVVRVA